MENLDDAQFCDSCGKSFQASSSPPTINVLAKTGTLFSIATKKTFELMPDKEILIGRGDPSRGLQPEVMLDDDEAVAAGVSRLHAKIFCEDNEYYITDLNSTNHTYLNDTQLDPKKPYKLRDSDAIRLGKYLLRLRLK